MAKTQPQALRYLGNGFVPNVPARDLSPDEVALYNVKTLLASGLYELITIPPPDAAGEPEQEPVE